MGESAKDEIKARIAREWEETHPEYAFIDGLQFAVEMIEAYEQRARG